MLFINHHQQRLEPSERPVGAPIFCQLHGCPRQVATVLLELDLELREQGKGVGRGAGKPGDHSIVPHPPDLPGGLLHHGIAEGDLSIPGHHHPALVAHCENGRASHDRLRVDS
jgi:hypothetical protein